MSKYLVKRIADQFDNDILVIVVEVLEKIETNYGTIIIGKYRDKESWNNQCYFLDELKSYEYEFSDDDKYKEWINE